MNSKPRVAASPLTFEAGAEPGTPIDLREYQKDKDIIRSFSKVTISSHFRDFKSQRQHLRQLQ